MHLHEIYASVLQKVMRRFEIVHYLRINISVLIIKFLLA